MGKLKSIKGNKVIKAGLGYTIGNYLLKGIGFLTVPIFTRLMSTQDYGIYSVYMTYDSIITVFSAFALHSSLKNAKYKYGEKFDEYVSSILILPIFLLTALLVLINVFCSAFSNLLGLNRLVLNILFCQAFANAIVCIYNNKLGIDYKYKDFLKISFANTICNVGLSIIFVLSIFANEKYLGRIIGSAIPIVVIAIYIYVKTFKISKPKVNTSYWKFGLGYSLPIIPHGISQIVLSSFDRIMIKSIVGVAEAGIYSLGCSIEQLVKVTTTSLDTVWGPWFYERMEKKDYSNIRKYSTIYAYGIFVLLSLLILTAPEIVYIMGSEEYQNAKYVVIPLLTCTYFTFLSGLPIFVEYYYQKTKMIAIGTMGAAVLNVALNSIFIRLYGYYAAAYTTLVSYFAYFLLHYLLAKKIEGKQLFNTKKLAILIVGIIVVSIVGVIFVDSRWIRFVLLVLFLAVNILYTIKGFSIWKQKE